MHMLYMNSSATSLTQNLKNMRYLMLVTQNNLVLFWGSTPCITRVEHLYFGQGSLQMWQLIPFLVIN